MSIGNTFDWISDPALAIAAQETWKDGSYQTQQQLQLVYLPEGPFSIAAGAGVLSEHIRHFRFSPEIIQRLGHFTDAFGRSILQESFLNHLQRMRLQLNISSPPEGTLLLPGQPLLILQGTKLSILLLESALRNLCWHATYWATQAAVSCWNLQNIREKATPTAPKWTNDLIGWKERAWYIGGGPHANAPDTALPPFTLHPPTLFDNQPLVQIRRLYQDTRPIADIWLTCSMEAQASVSKPSISFENVLRGEIEQVHFTRYQELFQPLVTNGRPVWPVQQLALLRQRTFKQLEAFHAITRLETYPSGWFAINEAP